MIRAWVLYLDELEKLKFKELDGESFESTDPKKWGLDEKCDIILAFHKASFLQAWLEGSPIREY